MLVILRKYIWLLFILKCSEAVRIFCYQPVPFDSHQRVFHILTEALAQDGHQLVALTTLPRKQPMANITEIDIHHVSYEAWDRLFDKITKHRSTFTFPDHFEFIRLSHLDAKLHLGKSLEKMRPLFEDENRKYDLMIMDANIPLTLISWVRFETPILLVGAMPVTDEVYRLVGAHTNLYFYPNYVFQLDWNPSLWQKLSFYYNIARVKLAYYGLQRASLNAFVNKQTSPHALRLGELEKRVGMLFLNVYRFWDRNRPAPIGSVIYMGGFHLKAPKSLPEDLKLFVDNSKRGVVLMNMGSKLKSSRLPARTLRVITHVFSQLPYDFIWKWDADKMPNKPSNVRIVKDLPQNDLLHHRNVRAFVSHGGMLSTHEAIAAGVPLVGLPVMADQWQNTRQYEELGIGIRLDIDALSEEDFKNAIIALVEEKKYRDNMLRWSRIASDERERSLETAARWTCRLTCHGSRHLRSPLADATFVEFYMIDVFLLATICVFVASVAIVSAAKRLIAALMKIELMKR